MKKISYLILILISVILFTLTLRGSLGNPSVEEIEKSHLANKGAFESSQESSRYAMILSIYNDRKVDLNKYPYLGTPDLGKAKSGFYSFFPPTLSVIALPFYILGLYLNSAQLWVFTMPAVFSILTMILILIICAKLDLHWSVGLFSALSFGFATNAWGYSVTLYAHIVSAFLLLSGIYLTAFWRERFNWLRLALFWFVYGLAIYLDYPNLITFLPLALIITFQGVLIQSNLARIQIKFNLTHFIMPLILVLMLGLYGYYNYLNFGNPLQLSNSLPRVIDIKNITQKTSEASKGSVPALQTRNLLEGIRSFSISNDRGILIYSPIVLLFIFGINFLKNNALKTTILSVAGINLLQYSMFGDPYGGWAFGSRYMIAVLPGLSILAGLGLARFSKNLWIKLLYSLVFIYSCAVSLLAPITTNIIPPFVEARNLNLDSSYIINIRRIMNNELNSYFYNYILGGRIPAISYYFIILALITAAGLTFIWWERKKI